jgi:hypothetical protein
VEELRKIRSRYLARVPWPQAWQRIRALAVILAVAGVGVAFTVQIQPSHCVGPLAYLLSATFLFRFATKLMAAWRTVIGEGKGDGWLIDGLLLALLWDGSIWILTISILGGLDGWGDSWVGPSQTYLFTFTSLVCYHLVFSCSALFVASGGSGTKRAVDLVVVSFSLWLAMMFYTVLGPLGQGCALLTLFFVFRHLAKKRLSKTY